MILRNILGIILLTLSLMSCSRDNSVSLSALKGKWIIINYWAVWCDSCVKEIPELNHFYQHNQDKNILLFGVNYDHTPMPDLILYPVLVEDPKKFFKLADVDVLPVTFIIDPQGKVVKSIIGPNTEKSLFKIMQILQKKNESSQ